jgi:hypothetical protein
MLYGVKHTPAILRWVHAALFIRDIGEAAQKPFPALTQKRDKKILVSIAVGRIWHGVHA